MCHIVIGHRIDLRGIKIGFGTRITERRAVRLPIAIVLMDLEVGTAAFFAGYGALAVRVAATACAWALVHNARCCLLLPCEVRDCRARTVIVEGNIDEMIRWVNRDLEKVAKAAVGGPQTTAG